MIYIVGAGPAGLVTGLFLVERGHDVIILEKEERIKSTPCGEGCDLQSLKIIPFDSSPYFERVVDGIKFILDEKSFYAKINGVVLNRQKWLEELANEFIGRGGKISFSNEVIKIDSRYIYTKEDRIEYEICIGADGPLSVVRKYIGGDCLFEIGSEYEMKYKIEENYLEFYLSKKFSHHYAWIFPKKETINAGIIGKFSKLDNFLNELGIDGEIISKKAGIIPYGGAKRLVKNNVALVGDAACMANPFSLGGISPAIHAAKILAKNISDLKRYEKEIKAHPIMDSSLIKGKKALEKLKDEEMRMVFKRINGKEIREIKYKDISYLFLHPVATIKFYKIAKALLHSIKWGW